MVLSDAVELALDSAPNGAGLAAALGRIREEFSVDRVSVHAFDQGRVFRVVASAGEALLGVGTELPIELSTLMVVASAGDIYRSEAFEKEWTLSRRADPLLTAMGFRSGCVVPLVIGNRARGALALTSRSSEVSWDLVIDAVGAISPSITLALHGADRADRPQILVCNEERLFSEGVARVLEQELGADVEICTQPADALSHAERAGQQIDIVVCDSLFGEGRTHSFLRQLRLMGVSAPALVLDSYESRFGHHVAMRSGAAGYVRRCEGPTGLLNAVHRLRAGETVGLSERLSGGRAAESAEHLTAQECKLLLLLERGLRFKQIAVEMSICESTAKSYARNVFAKLDVHSRAEAVYEARRQGLIDLLHAGATTAPVQQH